MRRAALALAALAILGSAACSHDKKPAAWQDGQPVGASAAPAADGAEVASGTVPRAAFTENPDGTLNRSAASPPAISKDKLSAGGLGPYKIGVTLQSLQSAKLVTSVAAAKSCDNYTTAKGMSKYGTPDLVFFKGRLLHMTVRSTAVATDKGLKIGSSLAKVKSGYPDGKQLDDWIGQSAWLAMNGDYALLFPIKNGKVALMQAGMAEPLQFKYTDNQGC